MSIEEQTKKDAQERDSLMQKFLNENKLTWHFVHNWVTDKGYVIITEEEYENMEVIDKDSIHVP